MSEMTWMERLRHARRVSVPIVAINTPDMQATMVAITEGIHGGGTPIVAWDVCRGTVHRNEAGKPVAKLTGDGEADQTHGQPAVMLEMAEGFPPETIVFMLNAALYFDKTPAVVQGIWNLRDKFKADHRMLILLGGDIPIPPSLQGDVVVIDEALPTAEELAEIVKKVDDAANCCGKCDGTGTDRGRTCDSCQGSGKSKRKPITDATCDLAVEAVNGLPAFSAEQAVAMALRPKGIDLDHLWSSKIKQVEQTRGLSVYRSTTKFADLGGLEPLKQYLRSVMTGRRRMKLIAWMDEAEKTGLAARGDTSGVNQDQEGQLLQFLEDHDHYGVMLVGVPGAGKSAICKATGGEFDRIVVRIDLGAMQSQWVGASQSNLRTALKVIEAIGGSDTLWLATSNSIDGLSGAMRSRFTDTFFFDLPNETERPPIWDVWLRKLKLDDHPFPTDDGWVGRNIRQCAEKAWLMNCSIAEAARYITPVGVVEREEIERLRDKATDRYLSAQYPGVYQKPERATVGRRAVNV